MPAGCLYFVKWYNQQEEEGGWGRAPGLRRLMNDQDEGETDFNCSQSMGY